MVATEGYASPGRTSATLSRLTSPESEAVRVRASVWWPAPRSTLAVASFQVSQLPVVGSEIFCGEPPSTVRVSVRVSFLPSPPTELAYRRSNW